MWLRVVLREMVIRRDHSKGGSLSTRHTTNMPAQQQTSSSGAASLLSGFHQRYNPFCWEFHQGSLFIPYPSEDRTLILSSNTTADDQPRFWGLLQVSFGLHAVSFGLLAVSFGPLAVSFGPLAVYFGLRAIFFRLGRIFVGLLRFISVVGSHTPRVVSSV